MQPYRQVGHKEEAPANSDAAGGTGLGLPLTRAMAESNARFTLHSESGRSTVADVVFMVAAQPSAAAF